MKLIDYDSWKDESATKRRIAVDVAHSLSIIAEALTKIVQSEKQQRIEEALKDR